ncbi:hypothetical protein FACS1894217_03640 [Clostridia bacterium]|nr:hypothetical protein FACS1894217_03640 [Clostridia bacterium]
MALQNMRAAFVNRSGLQFPVYNSFVSSQYHSGGTTAGGGQVGIIYPNEFYTVIPNDSYGQTSFRIIFRHNGNQVNGVIETSPGMTLDDYAWVSSQEPYHYFNSNGTMLVASATEVINGKTYRIFTANTTVGYRNKGGEIQIDGIVTGTKLATDCSTTGVTYGGFMLFRKKKIGSGAWQNVVDDTYGYGFVSLGLGIGSTPATRPIR